MMPAAKADDDATVMIPRRSRRRRDRDDPAPRPDDDATVLMPAAAAEPDAEATIAIPTPGRRRDAEPACLAGRPCGRQRGGAADIGELGGINPLVAAANPVLAAVAQIRHTLTHPDPEGLRASLRAEDRGVRGGSARRRRGRRTRRRRALCA